MKTATSFGSFVRTYCAIGAAISLLAIYQTQVQTQALLKVSTRYKWVVLMIVFAVNAAVGLYVVLRRPGSQPFWERMQGWVGRSGPGTLAGLVLVLLPVPLFLYARADFYGRGIEAFFRLFWLFWWMALMQAVGVRLVTGLDWPRSLALILLVDGMGAQLFTLGGAVSQYPFSMGWSEASRYYYGSLVFSRSLYGEALPLSVMHGSRYLLQSLPFAISGISLWGARLWQVLLWIGLTLWASCAVVRRLGFRDRLDAVLVAGWLFLFFFQGAVYYHLQVSVIIIMHGVVLRQPRRSLAAIVAASIWAGMSRVNWFPVPAMLAITLYVLEKAFRDARGPSHYLKTPVLWGVAGVVSALAGQALYVAMSGNTNLEAFASSFNSALLWYRWLPSPTNPIGIIPGVMIVSLPLMALIVWRVRAEPGGLHPLRVTSIAAMLTILMAGGLVVSTKIGGGGDLHNMDAYLVLLAILGAYGLQGSAQTEQPPQSAGSTAPWTIVLLMVVVPVAFSLLRLANPFSYDAARAGTELSALRREAEAYSKSGEVLFMYERHLLTFGMIRQVPMVADYEVVTLMEMAISGDEGYLGKYYQDLETHRFAAVVAHPQNLGVETGDFIEESDAWNRLVARPLLCQYKPAMTLDYSNVQILVPRARPCPEFPPQIGVP
ncbi:MAG: hypothetical protein V1755_03855 [Chloroflexota bacterium]